MHPHPPCKGHQALTEPNHGKTGAAGAAGDQADAAMMLLIRAGGAARMERRAALATLPDFELAQLRLCPRVGAVDLGEVEALRRDVDVHVLYSKVRQSRFCKMPKI